VNFTEKILHCYNCKKNFIFTVAAQEFRSSQGYPNDPANCPTCRRARKNPTSISASSDEDNKSRRPMFPVICTQCGKAVRVPFQPQSGRPIYCSECQMKTRAGR
jgi:CxxC-x17-CxxC domain-containing protein